MTAIEILLLILGFIFVGLSFLISSKDVKDNTDSERPATKELWSPKDEEMIQERIDQTLNDKVEEIIDHTTDRLNHLSNEKIMAVDEFSNQVIEKIQQNHKEVVFMYNMLGEKEKDLKSLQASPEIPAAKKAKPVTKPAKKVKPKSKVPEKRPETEVMVDATETNARIRQLHQSGKSILEISKELDMGQGEVKLIIDLYGG